MTPGSMLTRRKKMGMLQQFRTTILVIIWITILDKVHSQQDAANYYFPQPAPSRFVSTFSSRNGFVPQNSYSPLGFRANLASTAPASYHEQTLYIDPLEADQNSQYPVVSTRNPEYSELSPRPFSPAGGRPRPNVNAGSAPGHQFVPQKTANGGGNRVSNVPYQQNQFLAHFNEQDRSHQQPPRAPRPPNGFTPNRQASGFARQNNDLYPTHQQLPFRNSRNRFQPSSNEHAATPSSSEKPAHHNRFVPSSQKPPRPVAAPVPKAKPNKSLFQPRKPSLGNREANSPLRISNAPLVGKVGNNVPNASHLNKDVSQEIGEDETNNPNLLKSQLNAPLDEPVSNPSQELAKEENNKEAGVISSNEKAIILTSNFFLPPPSSDGTQSQPKEEKPMNTSENPSDYESEEYEDYDEDYDEDPTTILPLNESEISSTYSPSATSEASTSGDNVEDTTIQEDRLEATTVAQEINQGLIEGSNEKYESETELLTENSDEVTEPNDERSQNTDVTDVLPAEEDLKLTSEELPKSDKEESYSETSFDFKTEHAEDENLKNESNILGEAVVSVVTSKSVINGSTAFPAPVTHSSMSSEALDLSNSFEQQNPSSTENNQGSIPGNPINEKEEIFLETSEEQPPKSETEESNNSTESWVVVASIQTSRSISGARFLPFPAIEQEEKKQPLSELERKIHEQKNSRLPKKPEEVSESTKDSEESTSGQVLPPEETSERSVGGSISTESIIDKLDRVQSELSSGLLTGKFPILNEMPNLMRPSTTSTTTSTHQPVVIKKFSPKTTTNKTPESKKSVFDDFPSDDISGLLPPGFKVRPTGSYRNKKTTTTRAPELKAQRNTTTGRSFKNSPVAAQEIILAGKMPKDFKPNQTSTTEAPNGSGIALENLFSKIKFEDNISALLPKDYKPAPSTTTTTPPTQPAKKQVATTLDDISKFLPPGYKLRTTTTTMMPPSKNIPINDDVSHLLPPGFKASNEKEDKPPIVIKDDISKFLPPGFKPEPVKEDDNSDILKLLPKDFQAKAAVEEPTSTTPSTTSTATEAPVSTTSKKPDVPMKVVFPKSLNKRPGQRLTTVKTLTGDGPPPPPINIKKGPPTRATTEFTGWPTPSTTPISIEKLLEQQKGIAINIEDLLPSTTSTTSTTTTTTTTTTEAPRPTEPGLCRSECDLAGTIKIVDGVQWKPELLDHNTIEWKTLARELETQLNEVYINAPYLSRWYKKVRIDSFSEGSVLVDYFVELSNVTREVNTQEIKQLFHDALTVAPLPVIPLSNNQNDDSNENKESERGSDRQGRDEKLVKESFLLGRFVVEPEATDFIVIQKAPEPVMPNDDVLPQWAIVLIVIGVGSLLFIIVFGILVLINRQNRAKKAPTPLTTDMLNDLNKNHMGGLESYAPDEFYNAEDTWGDGKPPPIKPKRFTNSMNGSSGSNIYDSWRSQRYGDFYYDNHSYTPHKGDGYPPDEFEDSHQMYTYNNRPRHNRDYDPDF